MDSCGELKKLALYTYGFYASTLDMQRLQSGFLLKDILERFRKKVQSTLSPDRSLWMYFSHDITIVSMLKSLGLYKVKKNEV